VEGRLDDIRAANAEKLDEMRKTVDERLQSTLETRFNSVAEQLARVHQGFGEILTLAARVGDLKKIMSNVKVRGTFGEVQLAMLLDEFLAPDLIVKNAQIRDDSQERVEFAIKLPGHDEDGQVLLPIDAKISVRGL
jgi:DNA recombination protein RmuC